MPELPEVETIKNELSPHVIGRSLTGITIFWERMVTQPSIDQFRAGVIGHKIAGLTRRGKYLFFHLSSGQVLTIHLRMTGSLLVKPEAAPPGKFVRAIIHLDDGTAIHFRDPRKMGKMWLAASSDSISHKLGPEPLTPEFTPQVLSQLLGRRRAPIKAVLLDQNCLAGVGNMYADEALFAAGIHPLTPADRLSGDEINRLYNAIQDILSAAIGNKGASTNTYFRPSGEIGTAHFQFKVAHRGGEPCPSCGHPIQRLPIRNRGSYFCPRCQVEQPADGSPQKD